LPCLSFGERVLTAARRVKSCPLWKILAHLIFNS
jgi:hypothetical protein